MLIYILICICCIMSCHLLLESKRLADQVLKLKPDRSTQLQTYEDLTTFVMGARVGAFSGALVVALNMCFSAGFVICIRENLKAVYPGLTDVDILTVLTPILLLLGQVKWLNDLCIFSFLGALIYFVGVIGSSLAFSLEHFKPPQDLMAFRWREIVSYTGTAVYALEGICLVLPCERSMRDKKSAGLVVTRSLIIYGIVTCGYAVVALSSGIVTPDCDIIVDCLETGDGSASAHNVANTVRLALSAALCLSHPIQLYPAIEILELVVARVVTAKAIKGEAAPLLSAGVNTGNNSGTHTHDTKSAGTDYVSVVIRICCCVVTLILGTCISSFSDFSNFVGSVGLTYVGFVLPVFLYLTVKNERDRLDVESQSERVPITTKFVLALVLLLGVFNMTVTGTSSFLKLVGVKSH